MLTKSINSSSMKYFAIAKYRTIKIKIEKMRQPSTAKLKLSESQLNWLVSGSLSLIIAVLVFAIRN